VKRLCEDNIRHSIPSFQIVFHLPLAEGSKRFTDLPGDGMNIFKMATDGMVL
jgi:hypothetical protein